MSKRLGMGIDALLGDFDATPTTPSKVALDQIRSDPNQPRNYFDPVALSELATSIKANGIIQPLVVQKQDDHYLIVAGERRYRAALEAGLTEVEVVIKDFTADQRLEIALLENIQREDLKPIEEAKAYEKLIQKLGLTQQQLADRLGKSRSVIANALRLLELPQNIQQATDEGQLSASHARTLAGLTTPEDKQELYIQIKTEGLNVRKTEERATKLATQRKEVANSSNSIENPLKKLEKQLLKTLNLKQLRIRGNQSKGCIELPYNNDEELQQLMQKLTNCNLE